LVVTVHAPVKTELPHYSLLSKLQSPTAILSEIVTFLKAAAILSISETTTSSLVDGYGIDRARITVIGNGVDYARFSIASGRQRDPLNILMVSRLEPRKNVAGALRALSVLPTGRYRARIVGDGSQKQELQRMARSLGVDVEFLGRVSNEDLPSLYQEAGVFLTTSYSEGFGLTLLEAMAAGCAVVASDIPTHRDIIDDGHNGLVYRSNSDLAVKLESLLSNPDATKRIGKAGMETAKMFSWDSVAQKVLRVYEKCLSYS